MAFPSNPLTGDSYTIGSKTWYWDGSAWSLLPVTVSVPGSDGDDTVPPQSHDTPKVLDDLLDVRTGSSS